MTIDPIHDIIKLLLIYNIYNKYYKYIYKDKALNEIYKSLEALHALRGQEDLSVKDLYLHFLAGHQHLSENEQGVFRMMFEAIDASNADPASVESLLSGMKQKHVLDELALNAYDAAQTGKGMEKVLTSVKMLDERESIAGPAINYVTDDLEELYQHEIHKPGLRWPLDSLNKSLGSLRVGDFGFIIARPEVGKTTFLASAVGFMAPQTEGVILWLNNEEQGGKVRLRVYQSVLGLRLDQLFSDRKRYATSYQKLVSNRIKILDDAGLSRSTVEKACEEEKPALIVIDQLDKVKGFTGDRNDLELGEKYRWARELAKVYAPVIGVCQADATADGQKWVHMGQAADAKTSKQAEADWILGVGATNEVGFEFVRHFYLSKNKLMGDEDTDPNRRHDRWDVLIEPQTARYKDILL